MPPRRLVIALLAPLLFTGCMAQRDTPEIVTETEGSDMEPHGPAYLFGTWDFSAVQIGGDDAITGTLTIGGEGEASRLAIADGFDAPLLIHELDVTNANFVLAGTVQTDEPVPVTIAGSINRDEMSAEANVGGRGSYALTGTRRPG